MNTFNNLKIGVKLTGGFLLVAFIIVIVAAVGYADMKNINDGMTTLYFDRTLPIEQLGAVDAALYKLRGDLYKSLAIPVQRAESFKAIQDDITALETQKTLYDASFMKADEKAEAANFGILWSAYKKDVLAAIDSIEAGDEESVRQSLINGALHDSRAAVAGSLDKLIEINRLEAEALKAQGDETFASSIRILVSVTLAGLLLAVGLGLFLSRSLSSAAGQLVKAAEGIAKGELDHTLTVRGQDEMGKLARAFERMLAYLQEMAEIAGQVAKGDLTAEARPQSEKDVLGNAFAKMLASLSDLVGQVAENATSTPRRKFSAGFLVW